MIKLSEAQCGAVLHAYFEEGREAEEIARDMGVTAEAVLGVLGDRTRLEPYHARSEAARLRAQICVNESAEEAARMQAQLLRSTEATQTVTQRAAKDILDRAGVRPAREDKKDVTIRFAVGPPKIGMPDRRETQEEGAWTSR